MSDEELAKALGRSVGAVKAKMRQLKLKRNND
nr:MAG TPA: ECF sigma factor [Caudoviricetes sp.]